MKGNYRGYYYFKGKKIWICDDTPQAFLREILIKAQESFMRGATIFHFILKSKPAYTARLYNLINKINENDYGFEIEKIFKNNKAKLRIRKKRKIVLKN